jgi:hypothetical protein
MRTKVKTASTSAETRLARILQALEQELLDASEEEVLAAAAELGMNPKMKGSALFAGLKYPATPQLSDFFELGIAGTQLDEPQTIVAIPNRAKPKLTK